MQAIEQIPDTLDETMTQIAAILAQGYRRYEKNRRLDSDIKGRDKDVAQMEESEAFTSETS